MPPRAVSPRHAVLEELVAIALRQVGAGFAAFKTELAARLMASAARPGSGSGDCMRAASLLIERHQALLPLVTGSLERALREELASLAPRPHGAGQPLALVPYDEMDQRVTLGAIARPFDTAHADALAILAARLACLFDRRALRANPFRPAVFVAALGQAWTGFDGEAGSAAVLALVQAGCFHDLAGIYAALNAALERHGVVPAQGGRERAHDGRREALLASRLREVLALPDEGAVAGGLADAHTGTVSPRVLEWLAGLPGADGAPRVALPSLKHAAPRGMLSRADEGAIDLLGAVFDGVSADAAIATDSRELMQLLQLPMLKAALADKAFFFHADHPARRLLEMLSRMGWERTLRGEDRRDDRRFQAMRSSVDRATHGDDETTAAFAQAVRELEAALKVEEAEAAAAIAGPVAAALKQERAAAARRAARDAVALRVGTGEVVAVVETFLENKWADVLTVAYGVEDDKPGAVRHATQAMDDLLWSVLPKQGADERKALIARLPGLLSTLNRWLDVVRWQGDDRLRFFAELADCHASIVRAPLDMAPERRIELAVQATQLAAERRVARETEAARPAQPAQSAPEDELASLARGTWFDFTQEGGSRKVKLAWISPCARCTSSPMVRVKKRSRCRRRRWSNNCARAPQPCCRPRGLSCAH
ncbi:DUF1631 family protein [Pseudoduganella lutea]|uniref:DUF1631 family protein n=1 Tax=Pseudoduganella lutea TaxID=321985 RepID=UPI001E31C6D3|nr:DUF1631 family protein [Pseudoduganella lutea]